MMNTHDQRLDAIILTGGASRRMGVDKAGLVWRETRAVDRVAALARQVGAVGLVTAGPHVFGLPNAPDPAPLSGPVAGIRAGLALLGEGVRRVLVLAVDAPTIEPVDLMSLINVEGAGAAFEGLPLPMVFAPTALPADIEDNWPLRRLVERAGLKQITPDETAIARIRGANTPDERRALLDELAAAEDAARPNDAS